MLDSQVLLRIRSRKLRVQSALDPAFEAAEEAARAKIAASANPLATLSNNVAFQSW